MISKSLDFGRILGAFAIFYYHVGIVTHCPLSPWGEYAVSFFIIASGVAFTCFSAAQPATRVSYGPYVVSRLKAIFPMFIAVNLAIFLASYFHPSALGRPFTWVEFLLSSSGLSQYFGTRYLSTVMWFVPLILQAYLLFPLIHHLLNRAPGIWILIAAFGISFSLVALVFCAWPSRATEVCRNWSILLRLPETCLGLVLGRDLFSRRPVPAGFAALGVFAVLSGMLAVFISPRFTDGAYILSLPWNGLVVTTLIALISTAAAAVFRRSGNRAWLRLLGAASFPFFLIHGTAILLIHHRYGSNLAAWALYFAACWAAAIALTILFRKMSRRTR